MRLYPKLIILSLCLSLIPLVLVAGIFLFNTQKELKREIYDRLKAVSELKKTKVETFLDSRKEDLKAVQEFLDVQINLPTLEDFDRDRYSFAYSKAKWQLDDQLHAFMNSHGYTDILLMNPKGKIVFVSNPLHASYRDKIFFNEAALNKTKQGVYVSGPAATGEWRFPYVLYLLTTAVDTQGHFVGFVALQIDMKLIYDVISDNTGLGTTGETFLVKKMPPQGFVYISPLLHDPQAILTKEMTMRARQGVYQGVDYRGNKVLAVWKDIPFLDWMLVTKIDKQEIFASITNIRTLFFIICLLMAIMAILGSVFFAEAVSKSMQKLQFLTIHDPLTGVLNRRGLQEVLIKTAAAIERMGIHVQALLLDLDNFKQINDRYGHGVGDAVIAGAAAAIVQTVRQSDYVARVGGDEFLVLLLDSRQGDAVKVADKIRMAVGQMALSSRSEVKVTCSIGIGPLEGRQVSVDELLQQLHLSLHLSKSKGKNRLAYQGEQVDVGGPADEISKFKKVLASGERFYALFQPIFDLRDMSTLGYELLSRMDYEGYSSPDTFLLFARNSDLLGVVDYACLKTCLKALKNVPGPRKIFINLFPSTMMEIPVERLVQDFAAAGRNFQFCIEINEQQILRDPLYLIPCIAALKKAGITIALDDYGFGHSSIETLVLLEPDIVKIDKKIITGIAGDAGKINSLKRLLKIIDTCQASVIAEGIETPEDLHVLRDLGVVYGQGFLIGKPGPLALSKIPAKN